MTRTAATTRHTRALACLLALCGTAPAIAFERADPLDSRAGLPAAPTAQGRCPVPAGALSLAEVVTQALCRNPRTRISYAAIEEQAAALGSARSAWLPTLSASTSRQRTFQDNAQNSQFVSNRNDDFDQTRASLTLSYLIYDFGARGAGRDRARALLDAALASRDRDVQQLVFDAVQAFYQLRATDAQLGAARQAETTSRASLDAAETRHGVGVATPADVLQARTAHSQAVLIRIQAEGAVAIARGQLASTMGLEAQQPVQLAADERAAPLPDLTGSAERLIADARTRRPDLAAAQSQIAAAEADIADARASGRPTLSFGASQSYTDTSGLGSNEQASVGLTLSIPLFTGYATTYRVRGAEARRAGAEAQFRQLDQQAALEVWTAQRQLITAGQALESSADLLASAEASQDVALGRYKAGVGSVLDLLNAQTALADARRQRVQAGLDLDVARMSLALALGLLDERLATTGVATPAADSPEKTP